ncbi:DUF1489 domain-containing protein [Alphaproteobacteria bacterium]|nr:DUF1489 domain-containing protein [Alphaproteobacteria bacterium]
MTINLIKLAVGVESLEHLYSVQKRRLNKEGYISHLTRNHPKRYKELLNGGSIYWVIKGNIRGRQLINKINKIQIEGKNKCEFLLTPEIIITEKKVKKPHQGWRYLKMKDSPEDILNSDLEAGLPINMVIELKNLGLW